MRLLPTFALSALVLGALVFGSFATSRAHAQAWIPGPGQAQRQGWLTDRRAGVGPGIRAGDFELHPGLGVEFGADTNVFYGDANTLTSAIMRITPSLYLGTLSAQRTQEGASSSGSGNALPAATFRLGASGSYYHYFENSVQDNVEADAFLDITLNPQRPFAVQLTANFARAIRPFAENNVGGTLNYARNTLRPALNFLFQTTGGVLTARLGYAFQYDFFDAQTFRYADNLTHAFVLQSAYRFLPQTAIVADVGVDLQTFGNTGMTDAILLTERARLTARVGVNGAITQQLSAGVMIGYGAGFNKDPRVGDYDSLVLTAEARWAITEAVRLVFGYDRSFQPSFAGNFVRQDRGYLNLQVMVDGSFLLGVEGTAGVLDFGDLLIGNGMDAGVVGGTSTRRRQDIRVTAGLFAEYRFTNWFGLNATLRYSGQFTDYQFQLAAPTLDPARFSKFEAWVGARVAF